MLPNADRIRTPDLLRGIAVIFMIQEHIVELFAQQDVYDSLAGKISLSLGGVHAAPVFCLGLWVFNGMDDRVGYNGRNNFRE